MALTPEQQALDFNPELQDVSRQRKLADLLMSQGMQQPQGQMISGHYVAPSWTQQLNPIANIIAGEAVGNRADTKQTQIAEALRNKKLEVQQAIQQKIDSGDLKGALGIATQNEQYGGKEFIAPLMGNVIPKAAEPKVVGNYLIGPDGKVVFKAPKEYAPHAPQLVQTANGFVSYNPNTGAVTPVQAPAGMGGGAGGALMPPPSADVSKDIKELNQQKSIINAAIQGVEKHRQYFGGKYAAPELLGGEIGQAAMNAKLPEGAVEARSNVFNTASAVIKERAGTAQTPGEKTIIMRFLPSIYDTDATVIKKLNAYNQYIENKATGTTSVPGAVPAYQGQPTPNAPAATTGGWKVTKVE